MILRVRVIPNASRNEVAGREGSTVRYKVDVSRVDGKANQIVIRGIAELFEVTEDSIHIMVGQKSLQKTLHIEGRSEDELEEVMESIP